MQIAHCYRPPSAVTQIFGRFAYGLLSVVLFVSCTGPSQEEAPVTTPSPIAANPIGPTDGAAGGSYGGNKEVSPVLRVKEKYEASLLAIDGVEGVGIGQDATGGEVIVVYVRTQEVAQRLPKKLDGVAVEIVVTGPIVALPSK